MKKSQNHIKNAVKSMAAKMMKVDEREWPPSCSFLVYQPIRPKAKRGMGDSAEATQGVK